MMPCKNNAMKTENKSRIALSAINRSADSMIWMQQDATLIEANEAVCRLLGYSKKELLKIRIHDICPDFSEEVWVIFWNETKIKRSFTFDLRLLTKAGGTFYVEITASYLAEGESELICFFMRDITRRKAKEKETNRYLKYLENSIHDYTRRLRESLEKSKETALRLEDASRMKSHFLSAMSHEFRTPLNAIIGFNDLLFSQFYGNLNKKQLEYVRQIGDNGKQILSLINDLLDISMIDAGGMFLERKRINPVSMVNEVCMMMRGRFKGKNISLNIHTAISITAIYADIRKCKQIMYNLLSNALKYTPEYGSVDVIISEEGESSIRIEVRDTGIGIEDDEKDKIFSAFYQSNSTKDKDSNGAGIGLALTRRLVELHGGMIGVESKVGNGSIFWFTLPENECILHEYNKHLPAEKLT